MVGYSKITEKKLYRRLPRHFQGHFVVSMAGVYLKEYPSFKHFHTAGNVFKSQPQGAVVQLFKIGLHYPCAIMVQPEIHIVAAVVLGKMYKARVAVFDDIPRYAFLIFSACTSMFLN